METKLSVVKKFADAGDWKKAISLAAKFPRLGEQRGAILDAHMAFTNERFVRQMRKEPDALIAAGIDALRQRFDFN